MSVRWHRVSAVRPALTAAVWLPLLLACGCGLIPTTRKLPHPRAPQVTLTVDPEYLVARLDDRWKELNSLTATVEIQATMTKAKGGTVDEKKYPLVHGYILMRKPASLRVFGRYLGVLAFDMSSDGSTFTLSIPARNTVAQGSNTAATDSPDTWLNLRPPFFMDALVVRGLSPEDDYSVFNNTITVEDAARKHMYTVPEYILSIQRRRPGSHQLDMNRVIHFHRDDLKPYQQDIYNPQGNVETEVFYSGYRDFDSGSFPTTIVIKRPIEGIMISLTVEDVHRNKLLTDEQLTVKIPPDAQIRQLK